ncbi:hypothetical protein N871_08245 [Helicobacter pylori X47-2AL]|uniref:Uncharacterized protein n=1 Tax=Helicobacter pylori X47-2AL TaxID=1386083 RepID=V6L609_HELPX|nr:hypothetical protein N871_08245 [Helicobacter pylori X47-2AL]
MDFALDPQKKRVQKKGFKKIKPPQKKGSKKEIP